MSHTLQSFLPNFAILEGSIQVIASFQNKYFELVDLVLGWEQVSARQDIPDARVSYSAKKQF